MKIGIIGGGAWGTTLGQTLIDNGHQVLIYDVNLEAVDMINRHLHPFFNTVLPQSEKATSNLDEVVEFADYYVLSVPTKVIRSVLRQINPLLKRKVIFINVSKGIEPDTLKRVSEIVEEEINPLYLRGFVVLTGPS
ncbi:MAG: NAD(P)-binding domain-containing protein, partial [Acholeplasmataceae bacterium]|nr:NAD(P)-binding domain-containing protein [Acholeplasmataceae bacterium]